MRTRVVLVLTRIVVPILVGLSVGFGVARLPDPWPLVVVVILAVLSVVLVMRAERDIRRTHRALEALAAEFRNHNPPDDGWRR